MMLTGQQLSPQRHPQGVWKPSSQETPGDSPQKSPLAERALPRWREQTQRMGILETSVGALSCPGKLRSPRGRRDCHAVPRFPRTACPSAPPAGTEGCIVRDVPFSDVRWDFSAFSTSTKAFQAVSKDIWPSYRERLLCSVNSILTLRQDGAPSAGRGAGSVLCATKKQV